MKGWRALRALLRVELRQLRQHPGRSLLILLLVAIPVAAIVGGTALSDRIEPSPEERSRRAVGQADLRIDGLQGFEHVEAARRQLPSGARSELVFLGFEQVRVPGQRWKARLFALHPRAFEDEPTGEIGLAQGMLRILAGRAPTNAGEVALSPTLLEGLGRSLGEQVTLEFGGYRTITGVVADPEELDLPVVVRTPAAMEYRGQHFLLASMDEASLDSTVSALRSADFAVRTRSEAAVGDALAAALVFALGTVGLFEAALVISAAFAVSLRRRQVEIGLLGSVGATQRGLTTALVASAGTLAVGGGVLGTLLGSAAILAVEPWLDGWTNRLGGPVTLDPGAIVGAILLGILAAVLAAILPARQTAQLPIRDALAHRRPSVRRSQVWLHRGLALLGTGALLVALASDDHWLTGALGVVVGPILGILGFGACSPWLLDALARKASALPLSWRLAVRDAGRFRERNGAVITAVLAGMSMSVTMAALVASLESALEAFPAPLRDDQLLVEGPGAEEAARQITEQMPAVAAAPLMAAYVHGEPVRGKFPGETETRRRGWVAVGDENLAQALGAGEGTRALQTGQLLALDPPADLGGLELSGWFAGAPLPLPAVMGVETSQVVREPGFVLETSRLAELGFELGPPPSHSLVPWLVRLEEPLTSVQLEQAQALAARSVRTSVDAASLHTSPFRSFYHGVLLVCALTGLLVVVAATALSAAESAADERLLETVGAAPRLLRNLLASRAAFLAFLGSVLAVPAGLMVAVALFETSNFPLEFVIPWKDALMLVLGLPTLVYICAWCSAGFERPALVEAGR